MCEFINKYKNSAKYLFINYVYKLSGTQIKQKEMTLLNKLHTYLEMHADVLWCGNESNYYYAQIYITGSTQLLATNSVVSLLNTVLYHMSVVLSHLL